MTRVGHTVTATTVVVVALVLVLVLATPTAGAGAGAGLGDASVTPTAVSTGETTTLDISLEATAVNTSDGTTGANATVRVPAAVDLGNATVTTRGVTPNTTGVKASVDAGANTVVVSWDDATSGVDSETLTVTATVSDVAVDRTGEHEVTATIDANGDGTTDTEGTVGTVTAETTSARSVTTTISPLFLGEEDVDLTALDGAATAGEQQRFHGVGGRAEGKVATADDAAAAEISRDNGFIPGPYALQSGTDSTAVVVQEPDVFDIEVYPGRTTSGTDIADSSVSGQTETVTVVPEFDFEAAADARVVVEDGDGLEITDTVVGNPTASTSGAPVRLDVSDLSPGAYTIRVEGTDDLDSVSASVTLRVRSVEAGISVDSDSVTRGETTVVSIRGEPGTTRQIRVPASALRAGEAPTNATADDVFGGSDGVTEVGVDSDGNVLFATADLESDGSARVELDTGPLETSGHDIALATDATAPATETTRLEVASPQVSVRAPRSDVTIGRTERITGRADGADEVKLYARAGSQYVPLYEDASENELAETSVTGGSWSIELDTEAVVNIPDSYRIAAVTNPEERGFGPNERLNDSTIRGIQGAAQAGITTVGPELSASVSRSEISTAPSDEVTIFGRAPGPNKAVRAYVVRPRGSVAVFNLTAASDGDFDFSYNDFETPGRYRIIIVTAGRDDSFGFADTGNASSIRRKLGTDNTANETTRTIRDAYNGAGVDDNRIELNVDADSPRVDTETVRLLRIQGDGLIVSGTSNRQGGASLRLELSGDEGPVAIETAEVSESGRWRTTLDVEGVDAGRYSLQVESSNATNVATIRLESGSASIVTFTSTPTPTPTPESTTTPTPDAGTVAAGSEAARPEANGVQTGTTGDGFGYMTALMAVMALSGAALVAVVALSALPVRRRSE
ncbi:hypothetical protein [Haloplanus sp.]|uniref:hypothetical protein n=1 Tax=Haloplanus sp. TaxID=1961696 RepID=UPI00263A2995|nr:hypothetical protein [Haloplanus sp.]